MRLNDILVLASGSGRCNNWPICFVFFFAASLFTPITLSPFVLGI